VIAKFPPTHPLPPTLSGLDPKQVSDPQDLSIKFLYFWPVALQLLSEPKQLLSDLETYHKRHPNADVALMSQIKEEYLTDPDFAPKVVRKASVACEGLCKWSHAIVTFYESKAAMKDQENALMRAREMLKEAQNKLTGLNNVVVELQKKLQIMEKKLDRAMKEKDELQQETSALSKRINLSQELTRALSQEKVKWSETIDQIQQDRPLIVGDAMLGACLFAYGGERRAKDRHRLQQQWMQCLKNHGIPYHSVDPLFPKHKDGGIPLSLSLASKHEIYQWTHAGIPNVRWCC